MCWDYDDPSDYEPVSHICCRCRENGVGFNDDGDFLCEDCIADEIIERQFGLPCTDER
jgi:hypothetical protein